jgi:hypothetical protein
MALDPSRVRITQSDNVISIRVPHDSPIPERQYSSALLSEQTRALATAIFEMYGTVNGNAAILNAAVEQIKELVDVANVLIERVNFLEGLTLSECSPEPGLN